MHVWFAIENLKLLRRAFQCNSMNKNKTKAKVMILILLQKYFYVKHIFSPDFQTCSITTKRAILNMYDNVEPLAALIN